MSIFKHSFQLLSILCLVACNHHTKKPTEMTTKKEYQLVWEDTFDKPSLDTTKWNRQVEPAGRFNEEWQRYVADTANAYIENGCLVLQANHVGKTHGHDQYTSARLNTANKFAFTYGKVVARIKLPYGKGLWPAFWMLGANIDENGGDTKWPFTGEIDILELWGSRDNAVVEGNLHYANKQGKHTQMGAVGYHLKKGIFADDFHDFELEWTPTFFKWKVDGETYHTQKITAKVYEAFHKDFFFLLNIAIGGSFADGPDENTIFPQKMYVDYIKVYQKK